MTDRRPLAASTWSLCQRSLPIACVDVLPVQVFKRDEPRVGLINRDSAGAGLKWCLIGGRILRDESLEAAIAGIVKDALGGDVRVLSLTGEQPLYVAQYFSSPRNGYPTDPRKHAVALTYAVEFSGHPAPQGEAKAFEWFKASALPGSSDFGFGQDMVARACLDILVTRRK